MRTETKNGPAAPKKPTIKILLYTDDPLIAKTNGFGQFFGLGSMKERLLAHGPSFAYIDIKWFSRNSDAEHHADYKLDDILNNEVAKTGEPFDEIWFFGMHQNNTNQFSLLARRGGPESELNEDEVAALTEWMEIRDGCGGGGVLMTGDHNNENPLRDLACSNGNYADPAARAEFLGIGRALGHLVPRAGELRKWEGKPTYRPSDSFNTISDGGFQTDLSPQQLELRNVNVDGDLDENGQPHPLFFYKKGKFINVFPDHAHEGAVRIPRTLNPDVWRCDANGRQVQPQVVALGRGAREPNKPRNIIATYNGDLAGVGRIVADTTWHHYMNVNLKGFPHPAPVGSASDQIGQYYANLAVWLAPKHKRQAMARLMLWELARNTVLLEEQQDGGSTGVTTAQSVFATVRSGCELQELIQAYPPEKLTELYMQAREIQLSETQVLVGSVPKSYHKAIADPLIDLRAILDNVIKTDLDGDSEQHEDRVQKTLNTLPELSRLTETSSSNGTTTCVEADEHWTIDLLPDRSSQVDSLTFCLNLNRGIINGQVFDSVTREHVSEVYGTSHSVQSLLELDEEASFMTLNFDRRGRRVALSGVAVHGRFEGRFTRFVAAAEAAAAAATAAATAGATAAATAAASPMSLVIAASPGDGDTGSASGTQT